MSDTIVRLIRTVVPLAVGWAITALLGPDVDTTAAAGAATAFVIALYYAGAAALEARWPAAGWLLGVPKANTVEGSA